MGLSLFEISPTFGRIIYILKLVKNVLKWQFISDVILAIQNIFLSQLQAW